MPDYLVNIERKIEHFEVVTVRVEAMDAEEAKNMAKEKACEDDEWAHFNEEFNIPDSPQEVYADKQKVFFQPNGIGAIRIGNIIKSHIADNNVVTYQVGLRGSDKTAAEVCEVFTSYWKVTGGPIGEAAQDDCRADYRTWGEAQEYLKKYIVKNHIPGVDVEDED